MEEQVVVLEVDLVVGQEPVVVLVTVVELEQVVAMD